MPQLLTRAHIVALLWTTLPGLAMAECPPPDNAFNYGGGGVGGRVFTASNVGAPFGGLVPFTGGFDLRCEGQSLDVTSVAPTTTGGSAVIQMHGSASSSFAQARSAVTSSASAGPLERNTTPAVFADAAAIVNFKVEPTPLSPAINAVLRIQAIGEGNASGTGGALDNQGTGSFIAKLRTTGGSPSFETTLRDSTGYSRDNFGSNEVSGGGFDASRHIDFSITTTATFGFGAQSLQLDLLTFAWGGAKSDFSNTASISAFEVLTPGVTLTLPAGLYTADAANPNRFVLTALLPVPEPGSAVLMLAGGLLVAWRVRRR